MTRRLKNKMVFVPICLRGFGPENAFLLQENIWKVWQSSPYGKLKKAARSLMQHEASWGFWEQFVMQSWSESSQWGIFSKPTIHISTFISVWSQTPDVVNAPWAYYIYAITLNFLEITSAAFFKVLHKTATRVLSLNMCFFVAYINLNNLVFSH